MSDEAVTLELLGARLMGMTADVRDLQQRVGTLETGFSALERRFSALENRFSGIEARMDAIEERMGRLEDRMGRLLSLVVRIAERQGVHERCRSVKNSPVAFAVGVRNC
jgi:hypothetical protein